MHLPTAEETNETAAVVINWWELWPVYVSALVSVAGAVTSFFAPKAVEKLRHKLATELQEKQQEDALEGIREQHALQAKLDHERWLREERRQSYSEWMEKHRRVLYLLVQADNNKVTGVRTQSEQEVARLLIELVNMRSRVDAVASDEVAYLLRDTHTLAITAAHALETPAFAEAFTKLDAHCSYALTYMSNDLGSKSSRSAEEHSEMITVLDSQVEEYTESFRRRRAERATTKQSE